MSDLAASGSPMKRHRGEAVELIEQVRLRACLWDRASAGYRLRSAKDAAWQHVCRALQPGYDDMSPEDRHEIGLVLMRKWYNIRDAYKKYNSKGSTANGRPYVYADLLTFLIPTYEGRVKCESVKYAREDEEHDEKEEWLSVFDLEPPEPPAPKRTRTEAEHSRHKDPEADDSIVSVLVNLIDKEEDEDRAFFKSITPTVKALPEEAKFLFRIQVMKLLNDLRKKSNVKTEIISDGSDTE